MDRVLIWCSNNSVQFYMVSFNPTSLFQFNLTVTQIMNYINFNFISEPPSCSTSFSANRDGDFTSATLTYQLATPPPVTSTTVTYCSTSSPNYGNNTNCSSTGPCTISGLDPCVEYNLSAIPTNNCGSPTGCTGNIMVVTSQGQSYVVTLSF